MVLSEFLSDTRRRWLKGFKLFKRTKHRKSLASPRHNRVSPSPSPLRDLSGTVDASADIAIERFCNCPGTPPFPSETPDSTYENLSYCSDSAYETDRSSPSSNRSSEKPTYEYEVSFYLKEERESDCCSITTELTWLDDADEECESRQNVLNERIELMTSL